MGLYANAVEAIFTKTIDLSSDALLCWLIDTDYYTVNLDTHDSMADVAVSARIASVAMSSQSFNGRVFDAADATFSGITGAAAKAVIIAVDGASDAASTLIFYTSSATGLPTVALVANTVQIQWDGGASKIFKIG